VIESRARRSVRNGLMRNVRDILTTRLVPEGPPYSDLDPCRSHGGPTNSRTLKCSDHWETARPIEQPGRRLRGRNGAAGSILGRRLRRHALLQSDAIVDALNTKTRPRDSLCFTRSSYDLVARVRQHNAMTAQLDAGLGISRLRVRFWWCAEEFLFDPVEDVQYPPLGALLHLVASRLFPLGQEHPAEFVVASVTLNRSIPIEEHLVVISKEWDTSKYTTRISSPDGAASINTSRYLPSVTISYCKATVKPGQFCPRQTFWSSGMAFAGDDASLAPSSAPILCVLRFFLGFHDREFARRTRQVHGR
jgi:hypothetical protein